MEEVMLLEAAGTATAAAGGLVLRQAFKTTNTRTMTTQGAATGNFNQGDVYGTANMNHGAPARSAANTPPPEAAAARAYKRPLASIVIGSLLIAVGILMICAGLYFNQEMSRV
jgi:hypothetical protein